MALLKKAEITTAYFKCGILGFQGSGKTFTAIELGYGLCRAVKNNKLAFFDTEKASDFFVKPLAAKKIEFLSVKSRAFSDLMITIDECVKGGVCVLVVDSLTHVWREICDAYAKKLGRKRLQFQDWMIIKGEWRDFTDALINSPIHMIICGRAGYEYDYDIDDQGNKDLIKTGTKMKAEAETGFEPDLVIEMESVTANMEELAKIEGRKARTSFKPKVGSKLIHRAHILKDRADVLDGHIFDNPTFDNFQPHFKTLNIGGKHLGVDTSRTSQERFSPEGKTERQIYGEKKGIALEEIKGAMVQMWPGQSAPEKKAKADFIDTIFGTKAWAKVEKCSLEELEAVVVKLNNFAEKYEEREDIKKAWEAVKDG